MYDLHWAVAVELRGAESTSLPVRQGVAAANALQDHVLVNEDQIDRKSLAVVAMRWASHTRSMAPLGALGALIARLLARGLLLGWFITPIFVRSGTCAEAATAARAEGRLDAKVADTGADGLGTLHWTGLTMRDRLTVFARNLRGLADSAAAAHAQAVKGVWGFLGTTGRSPARWSRQRPWWKSWELPCATPPNLFAGTNS